MSEALKLDLKYAMFLNKKVHNMFRELRITPSQYENYVHQVFGSLKEKIDYIDTHLK